MSTSEPIATLAEWEAAILDALVDASGEILVDPAGPVEAHFFMQVCLGMVPRGLCTHTTEPDGEAFAITEYGRAVQAGAVA